MRFLIVKTSAIGDVITALDGVAYLRARFPDAQIDWVVEKAGSTLLQAHPHLNRVLVCDTKKWRKAPFSRENRSERKRFKKELRSFTYDVLFDLQGNTKSAYVTLLAKAKEKVGFCWRTVPEKPNVLVTTKRFTIPKEGSVRRRYLTLIQSYFGDETPFALPPLQFTLNPSEEKRLASLLKEGERRMKLMVAFGSNWKNKQLPQEHLISFLQEIDRTLSPYFFFPYGNDDEKNVAEALVATFPQRSVAVGEMSLPFWQNLIGKMECLITKDSAALHLAGTTTTPSFSLFGPSKSSVYKPHHSRHFALQGACPYNTPFTMRCPKLRTCLSGACMHTHQGSPLIQTFIHFWKEHVVNERI